MMAENETTQAEAVAAASDDNDNARPLLDPQLLMAARRGDSDLLKELLLQLNNKDEKHAHAHGGMVEVAAASSDVVIVDVVPPRRPSPAPAPAAAAAPTPTPSPSPPPTSSSVPLVDGVTLEGDTLLHVVAACGDDEGFLNCAKMIVHEHGRLALEARNRKGDTPLHSAAAAGNANMISCLVDALAAADEAAAKALVRAPNKRGETVLHQAVRAGSKAAIDQLLSMEPELADAAACSCSPFYLAVSLWGIAEHDEMDIARHLFNKTRRSIRSKQSYYSSGPDDGRNVLHAAISRASVETLVLLSQLLTSQGQQQLLSQLASQGDKENGTTPLHLAASLAGLPSSFLLLPPQVRPPPPGTTPLWPPPPLTLVGSAAAGLVNRVFPVGIRYFQILPLMPWLVLNANEAMAYQPDKAGMYPVHAAAGSGSLSAVVMLLQRFPDCATLRDAKGRTLLHVAAEENRYSVVKYVCGHAGDAGSSLLLSSILNAQDINGDTPLHCAVHAGHFNVVRILVVTHQVRLDVPNKLGMRPIDVSWTTMPLEAYYAWDFRIMIRRSLLEVGAPYGENNRGDLFSKKCILPNQDEEKKMSENLTAAAQVLALFSVLITTVTFASAFTLPGGSRSAGDNSGGGVVAGTPVLAGPRRSYTFDVFILADALAFGFSLLATSILLYAGVPAGTLGNRFRILNFAYGLMWHSARSLLVAFGLGLFLVLLPVARSIAIAVAVLMILLAVAILKESEGIKAILDIPMIGIGRSRPLSTQDRVLYWILFVFNHYWSYILIFGFPAIRKWPRFTLSPY